MGHQVSSKTSQSPCFERECSKGSHPLEFEPSGAGNVVCFNNGWYSASDSSCYWGIQGRLFNPGSEASSGNRWDRPQVLSNQSEGHRADCVAEKTGVSGSDLHRQGCNDGHGGLLEDTIISIEPAGVHLIWDCSVDIDHSYVSEGGLVNHNSRPNVTATSRDGPIRHLYQSHWDSIGGWLVTRDYSGIEVRIMACMSKCPALTKVLIDGIDVHFNTQTYFFGEKANAKDKSQRSICKQTLFGNIYGQGDQGLFDLLKAAGVINPKTGVAVTIEDCHEFNQLLYEAYPGIGLWIQQAHVYGIINQCTGSGFGFIRRLQALGSWDFSRKVKSCMNYDEIRAHPDYRRLTSAVSKDLRRAQNCVDMETEILTRRGWLTYNQVTLNDEVLTKNPLTLRYEFHVPTRINIYPESNAPVVICETNAFSSAATLDHRWLATSRCSRKRVKVQRMVTTEQLIESRGKMALHRTGDHDTPDGEFDDRFLAIIGWYLTDSSLKYNRAGLPVYVIIGQSERANPTKCDRIRILIEGITAHHHFDGVDQFNQWRLDNAVSARLIALLPGRKLTAEFVFSLSQRQARLLMDEMRQGDGNVWRGAENWSDKVSLYAEDEVERDAIQTLVCWAGKASNSRWYDTSGARASNKLRKPITNSKGCWVVSVLSRETTQMLPQQVRIVDDHRLVWCPTVTNGTWIARRRGCVYVTGNCPVQSTAGDLTSFAALRIQERMEEEGLGEGDAKVCSVIHDDIWTSARTAEMCPHILTIMEEVMDRPWEWLPKMLPGFDPEWLKLVPIFGECELGISPKDVMPGKMNKGVLEVEIDKLDFENFHLSDSLIIREKEINDGKKIVTKVTVDFLHVAEPMRPLLAERRKLKLLTL